MSNVHGFDFRNREEQNRGANGALGLANGFQGLTLDNLQAVEKHKVLLLSGRERVKNPREEHYGDMLKWTCCPVFKLLSFTTFILIVDLVMYIVELALGLNQSGQFLQVQAETLVLLGANYPLLIRQGEVWRLITAAVLHVDFLHFIGNFVSTIILLSRIQYSFGTPKTIVIYLFSAIGGNIFSAVCQPNAVKAGASTSLYGLLGILIAYLIINWNGLDLIGPVMKCQLVCIVIMLFIFILVFSSVSGFDRIDYFGHLGGLLTGLWICSIHDTIVKTNRERNLRIISGILLFIQFLLCFTLFYSLPGLV